jgi:predicted amidohydrolase YtcJ
MRCTSPSGSRTDPTKLAIAALVLALAACGPRAQPPAPTADATADLVVLGADVRTMDADAPHATAIAVKGGVITAVGDDAAIRALVGPMTRVFELAGETVTPGLVDGHCHLYGLGMDLDNISVRDTATAEAAAKVVAAAAAAQPNEWILGRGWDQNKWPGQAFPEHATLDAVLPARPVVLKRVDGHAMWVNAEALRRANITKATPDPAGGKILRDAAGEPTGVLVDNAQDLMDAVIPPPSSEVRESRIRRAAKLAVSVGLTGVEEMGIDDDVASTYRILVAGDEGLRGTARAVPLRVYAYLAGVPADSAELRQRPPELGDGRFALRGVKFFADGALGSRGARLLADYTDEPGNLGLWVTEPDELARAVGDAVAGGWQVAVHAIGDAGNRAVLDAYETALAASPGDHRLRIEHVQVIAPEDIPRLAKLGVIASMQPTHATSDMPWAEARIGPERIKGAYAWRTLREAGALVVAGSDFPVEEVSPLLGVYAAVTRQDPAGNPAGGWYADQKMTLDQALAAFTTAPAYAAFAENERGQVKVGMAGDLTIFDRPLVAGKELLAVKVKATIVAGEVVYEPGEEAAAPR